MRLSTQAEPALRRGCFHLALFSRRMESDRRLVNLVYRRSVEISADFHRQA